VLWRVDSLQDRRHELALAFHLVISLFVVEENDAFLEWINQEHICEQLITYRSGREQAPDDDEGNRMHNIDRMGWKDLYFMTTVYLYSGDALLVITDTSPQHYPFRHE
jgi:hypothetical protein